MWALSVPAFRQVSKNGFQTTLETLSSEEQEGFLALLGCQGKEIPHSSTVDHALSMIEHQKINEIWHGSKDKIDHVAKMYFPCASTQSFNSFLPCSYRWYQAPQGHLISFFIYTGALIYINTVRNTTSTCHYPDFACHSKYFVYDK